MKIGASATSRTAVIGIKLSNMLETLRTVGGSAWLRYRVIPFHAEQPKVCENPHPSGAVRDRTVARSSGMDEIDDRFRSLADSAPVLMWMSGLDAGCTFFNKGWLDFTGRSLERELGNGWSQGVHSDDLEACLQVYRDAFQARREFEMEYRLRRQDGHYRWIRDTGVPRIGPDGSFLGYIGSAYDITELKQAEDRSRQVLEAAPSGMIVVTREGAIAQANAAAEAIFGYPRDELLGRPMEAVVPERFCSGPLDARRGFQGAPT